MGKTKGGRGRLTSRSPKKEILFLEAEAEILLQLRQNVQGRGKVMGRCGFIINAGSILHYWLIILISDLLSANIEKHIFPKREINYLPASLSWPQPLYLTLMGDGIVK